MIKIIHNPPCRCLFWQREHTRPALYAPSSARPLYKSAPAQWFRRVWRSGWSLEINRRQRLGFFFFNSLNKKRLDPDCWRISGTFFWGGGSHGGGGSEEEKDRAPGFMLENLLLSRRVLGRIGVWRGEELCGGGRWQTEHSALSISRRQGSVEYYLLLAHPGHDLIERKNRC